MDTDTRGRDRSQLKRAFIETLERNVGIVTLTCKKIHIKFDYKNKRPIETTRISRTTFYKWMKKDKKFRRKVKDIQNEIAVDFVESKMFENIKNNDSKMIEFFLSTRGKHRGYTKRVETDGVQTITFNITSDEAEY